MKARHLGTSVGLIVVAIFIAAFFFLELGHEGPCSGTQEATQPRDASEGSAKPEQDLEIASAGVTLVTQRIFVAAATVGALLIAIGAAFDSKRWGSIACLLGWATYFPLAARLPAQELTVYEWAHVAEVCSLLFQIAVEPFAANGEARRLTEFTIVEGAQGTTMVSAPANRSNLRLTRTRPCLRPGTGATASSDK